MNENAYDKRWHICSLELLYLWLSYVQCAFWDDSKVFWYCLKLQNLMLEMFYFCEESVNLKSF